MKRLFTIMLFVNIFLMRVNAQTEKEEKQNKIEAYKIAFISERLSLTPKEATVFWPVYNEYNVKITTLRKNERERSKAFNQVVTPTDSESDLFIKEYLLNKEQQSDLTKKYVLEFKKVLPSPKVAKLLTLEQEFKMQLLHKYKEKKSSIR